MLEITNEDYNKWTLFETIFRFPYSSKMKFYYVIMCMTRSGHSNEMDQTLISGWIRSKVLINSTENYRNAIFTNKDVIYLISLWFIEGEIHFLKRYNSDYDQCNHFSISIANVLCQASIAKQTRLREVS